MKTPDYHNPQNVDPSNLKPGERFLLREELGSSTFHANVCSWSRVRDRWSIKSNGDADWGFNGVDDGYTYKTTLPLPPEYREPDYSDPEYQRSVEQAFRDGKRIQYQQEGCALWLNDPATANLNRWNWSWFKYRIHPEDIDKEIDWKTPEKQAEVRRMWADNPAMERDQMHRFKPGTWLPCEHQDWFSEVYYRPAQKPREKSQEEISIELAREYASNFGDSMRVKEHFLEGWNAREASRKGVA